MSEIIISGSAGRIEGQYYHSNSEKAPCALILHPHPLHGGSMHNKVSYNLYKRFSKYDFSILRINFRGVGKSEGSFDNGVGELQDAITAIDWLHENNKQSVDFWVAGFSFGAWIALQLSMRRPDIENYILAAPPVTKYDFNFIVPSVASGLIIQGTEDNISKEEDSHKLHNKLCQTSDAIIEYGVIDGADHFFTNKLDDFNSIVSNYISNESEKNSKKIRKVKRDRRRRRRKKNLVNSDEGYSSPIKSLLSF